MRDNDQKGSEKINFHHSFYRYLTSRSRKHIVRPYLIAIVGILADWITTSIGLMNPYRFPGLVLYETNSHYSPLWGLLIFLTVLTIFVKIQKNPPGKGALFWRYLISFVPWIGPINNILVLLGVWRGLIYLFS